MNNFALKCTEFKNLIFNQDSLYIKSHKAHQFHLDLFNSYGYKLSAKNGGETNNSFSFMGEELLKDIDLNGLDLMILAHDTPDIEQDISVVNYLAYKFNLNIFSFALSDMGDAAPFAALFLMKMYMLNKGFKKSILIILNQNNFPKLIEKNNEEKLCDCGSILILEKEDNSLEGLVIKDIERIYIDNREHLSSVLSTLRVASNKVALIINESLEKYFSKKNVFIAPNDKLTSMHFFMLDNIIQYEKNLEEIVMLHYESNLKELYIVRLNNL